MADIPSRKPILTIEQQIEHLRRKGVSFELCSEAEAARILAGQDHYFRLAAYRVLFPKRVGGPRDGQYAGLDFGHLVDLAAIDRELRGFLLPLTLDVENSAKTRLVERITEKPDEDGYSIFSGYLAALNHGDRNRREGELNRLKTTPTSDRSFRGTRSARCRREPFWSCRLSAPSPTSTSSAPIDGAIPR